MNCNNGDTTNVPQTLQQAIIHFSDPAVCIEFLKNLRWPDGVTCPYCNGKEHSYIKTTRVWHCKACKKRFSIKVGTVMEDSPIPLQKWLPCFWLITSAKNGISSYEIHRALGVTQKTAWFMLHRVRLAMHNGTIEKMSGTIEADKTFIGGKARNMHKHVKAEKIQGRGASGKEVVLGLLDRGERKDAESKKKKIGKHSTVRVKHVPDTTAATLQGEVKANVEAGSEVFTDAAHAYQGLSPEYVHEFVDHAIAYVEGNVSTNGLENFWTLFKRSINGTYVSVEPFHLFRYLDEQSFRFNEREGTDADRFQAVLKSVVGRRLTYKELTGNIETD